MDLLEVPLSNFESSLNKEVKPDLFLLSSGQVMETHEMMQIALAENSPEDEAVFETAQIHFDALKLHKNEIRKEFENLKNLFPVLDSKYLKDQTNKEDFKYLESQEDMKENIQNSQKEQLASQSIGTTEYWR